MAIDKSVKDSNGSEMEVRTINSAVTAYLKRTVWMDDSSLKLANENGFTFAHFLAHRGHIFDDNGILTMADNSGLTVAHAMALNGYIFSDREILNLKTNSGVSVQSIVLSRGLDKLLKGAKALQTVYDYNLEDTIKNQKTCS